MRQLLTLPRFSVVPVLPTKILFGAYIINFNEIQPIGQPEGTGQLSAHSNRIYHITSSGTNCQIWEKERSKKTKERKNK